MSSADDAFELLTMGYDESEICWDCGHVMGGGYLPGRFTPDCQDDGCHCKTCAEKYGDHEIPPQLYLVKTDNVLPDNLLKSPEEASKLPREKTRTFTLGTYMGDESFTGIGPHNPDDENKVDESDES